MKNLAPIPSELTRIIENIYEPASLKITSPIKCETESIGYGACRYGNNCHKNAGYHKNQSNISCGGVKPEKMTVVTGIFSIFQA
jgi:hypothetical protein